MVVISQPHKLTTRLSHFVLSAPESNKCVGDDTKGAARRSPNYIRKTKKYVLWNAINCFLTQNFTKIGQSAAELWPKIFNDMKHRAVSLWRVNRLRFHVTSSVYVCKHYFSNHVLFVKVILSVIVKFSAKSLRPIHLTSPKADVCRPRTVLTVGWFITAVRTVTTSITPACDVNAQSWQVAAKLVSSTL